jgi:hypothetical protein
MWGSDRIVPSNEVNCCELLKNNHSAIAYNRTLIVGIAPVVLYCVKKQFIIISDFVSEDYICSVLCSIVE